MDFANFSITEFYDLQPVHFEVSLENRIQGCSTSEGIEPCRLKRLVEGSRG